MFKDLQYVAYSKYNIKTLIIAVYTEFSEMASK